MIKKQFLVLFFLCSWGFVFSQSISLNQTELIISGPYNANELVGYVEVTNNTNDTVNFAVARIENTLPSGMSNYFCWDLCYGSTVDSSGSWALLPDDTFTGFSAHLEPDLNSGASSIDYVFYNVDNPTDFVLLSATFTVWGMEINNSDVGYLHVYPTLAQSTFTVEANGFYNPVFHLDVFDITGKKIDTHKLVKTSNKVDIINYKPGIYFIRVYSNNELMLTKKLVKK